MSTYQPDLQNLSLQDCVRISGKSVSTVRRRKAQLIEVGATCSKSGWSVTREQLAAVGLAGSVTPATSHADAPETPSRDLVDSLKKQVQFLEEALERERLRADRAESRLDRLLPAAPEPEPTEHTEPAPEPAEHTEQRTGFFRRLFGM